METNRVYSTNLGEFKCLDNDGLITNLYFAPNISITDKPLPPFVLANPEPALTYDTTSHDNTLDAVLGYLFENTLDYFIPFLVFMLDTDRLWSTDGNPDINMGWDQLVYEHTSHLGETNIDCTYVYTPGISAGASINVTVTHILGTTVLKNTTDILFDPNVAEFQTIAVFKAVPGFQSLPTLTRAMQLLTDNG